MNENNSNGPSTFYASQLHNVCPIRRWARRNDPSVAYVTLVVLIEVIIKRAES